MKSAEAAFRVRHGAELNLKALPTKVEPRFSSPEEYTAVLNQHVGEISELQELHYAEGRYALLLIFQGMDAAGKDGAIRHVMSGINPQGCEVHSFKQPSAEELRHDFLWRSVCRLPERGKIGIFNRSYYEDVSVVRVHPEILEQQGLKPGKSLWDERYESIRDHEKHLFRNGTRILKFFLHISKEEQRRRLLARIDDPEKNCKLSPDDLKEREFWGKYRKAYDDCLSATSTHEAPWYVIPADDKKNARLVISEILLDALRGLKLEQPKTTPERKAELAELRKQLV